MRAVIRESAGMVFHAQAPAKYLPKAPTKGTDEVMLSVRAAAINPVDYKVFRTDVCMCVYMCVCICVWYVCVCVCVCVRVRVRACPAASQGP